MRTVAPPVTCVLSTECGRELLLFPLDCKTRFCSRFLAIRLQHSFGEQTFRHFILLSLISLVCW